MAKLMDRTAFAGSVATADRLVRTMTDIADVPLIDAVRMMTITPARIMGVDDKKGSIAMARMPIWYCLMITLLLTPLLLG